MDLGTQVLVQVGSRVDCYDWRELRRVKPSQLRNKSRRLVVVSLVLVFEDRTYLRVWQMKFRSSGFMVSFVCFFQTVF